MKEKESESRSLPATASPEASSTPPEPAVRRRGRRYRLMFFNERKDHVVFSFSMPTYVAALLFVVILSLTAVLVVIIMTQTPLRSYLPGYLDVEKRAAVVETALRLDSLERESALRGRYLTTLTDILSGRVVGDSIIPYDSAVVVTFHDSLLGKTGREEAFVARFEEEEKYSLNAILHPAAPSGHLFLLPVSGEVETLVVETRDVSGRVVCRPEARVTVRRTMPVLAPAGGAVVAVDYVVGEGYTLVLQHANGYVTAFTGLAHSLVRRGETLRAGAVIGHAGGNGATAATVGISVWLSGNAIPPADVILF